MELKDKLVNACGLWRYVPKNDPRTMQAALSWISGVGSLEARVGYLPGSLTGLDGERTTSPDEKDLSEAFRIPCFDPFLI